MVAGCSGPERPLQVPERGPQRAAGEPTSADVPDTHPFYRYIGTLSTSGITVGCPSVNYCPDAPLTRGQMAVFPAKALGLHRAD